eukprot:g49682.t1
MNVHPQNAEIDFSTMEGSKAWKQAPYCKECRQHKPKADWYNPSVDPDAYNICRDCDKRYGEWATDWPVPFCGCCAELGFCLQACCCPCVASNTNKNISEVVHNPAVKSFAEVKEAGCWGEACLWWSTPCGICCGHGCILYGSRQRKRAAFASRVHMPEKFPGLKYECCCYSCALTQEYRSLKHEFKVHREKLKNLPALPPPQQRMNSPASTAQLAQLKTAQVVYPAAQVSPKHVPIPALAVTHVPAVLPGAAPPNHVQIRCYQCSSIFLVGAFLRAGMPVGCPFCLALNQIGSVQAGSMQRPQGGEVVQAGDTLPINQPTGSTNKAAAAALVGGAAVGAGAVAVASNAGAVEQMASAIFS